MKMFLNSEKAPRPLRRGHTLAAASLVALAALVAAMGLPHPGSPTAAYAAQVRKLDFPESHQVCLPPQQLAAAVQISRLPAVNPTRLVARSLHIRLAQVIVTTASAPFTGKQIHLLFGRVPRGSDMIRGPLPLRPRFAEVQEYRGPGIGTRPYFSGRGSAPWGFHGYSAKRNLSIDITSNGPRNLIERLGYALLAEASGAK